MQKTKSRSVLGLVFLTVFIDLVGFSIIFPLFPHLLDHYLGQEGPDSLIGGLVEWLKGWTEGVADPEWAVTVLFGGVLGSVYSLMQFAFAPIWGSLSDRFGRRPVLLFTLGGTALSYLAWFFAGEFIVLVVARVFGGLMAGNISIVSAVVADTHAPEERAKGMGIVGMAIGLGFVFGPALGGLASLYQIDQSLPAWTAYGVNPFSAAAGLAFILALFNWIWALTHFPETRPKQLGERGETSRTLRPFATLKQVTAPGVQLTNFLSFFYLVAFSAMEFTLTFLATERFQFSERQLAGMFVFVGLTIAVVQGGFVRRLAPRYGERNLSRAGLALLLPGFLLIGLTQSVLLLYGGLFFMAVGSAFAMPCLSALVSRYSPPESQGLVLGAFRSVGALSRAIGPLAGGVLYYKFGSQAPYLSAVVFLLLPLWMSTKLPPPPALPRAPESP